MNRGWYLARKNGTSHRQFKHPTIRRTLTDDGFAIVRDSVEKLKRDLPKGILCHFEGLYDEERIPWMNEPYNFEHGFQDIPTLPEGYSGLTNQTSLARISGINKSLMRQYVAGIKNPGRKVTERIDYGLKKNAEELRNISFV
jgi:hypothetical protein